MWNSKRHVLPGGNLLEIEDTIIRIFEYNQLAGKYYYLTSREVIDYEVQFLKIDDTIITIELQKHITSMVRNAAFL
jgi:hypothetical protein